MPQKIDNQTYFHQAITPKWETPPIVIAWKFSSAGNLGAILRVCDNFGVQQVFFVGDAKDYKKAKIKRNATTSFDKIDWCFIAMKKAPDFGNITKSFFLWCRFTRCTFLWDLIALPVAQSVLPVLGFLFLYF